MAKEKSKEETQDAALEDIEVLEFSLSEEEIDDLMDKLKALKKTKTDFSFQVDRNNEFIIHYANYEEESEKSDLNEGDEKFYENKDDE